MANEERRGAKILKHCEKKKVVQYCIEMYSPNLELDAAFTLKEYHHITQRYHP